MKKKKCFLVGLILVLILAYLLWPEETVTDENNLFNPEEGLARFSSEEEFREYLRRAETTQFGVYQVYGMLGLGTVAQDVVREGRTLELVTPAPGMAKGLAGMVRPEPRYSGTNLQVAGVDEPDIVKTDGENLYFSPWTHRFHRPEFSGTGTHVIKAYPPEELSLTSRIGFSGELLLEDKTLLVLSAGGIHAYDVSNPMRPRRSWLINLEKEFVGARLYAGRLYVVLRDRVDKDSPCPMPLVNLGGEKVVEECVNIYHPVPPTYVDTSYHILTIDPRSGDVVDTISFLGCLGRSVIYMSTNAIYVTYPLQVDPLNVLNNFFEVEYGDLFPREVLDTIKRVSDYGISVQAKLVEIQVVVSKYIDSLGDDERMRIRNELLNRFERYVEKNFRDLERTGIVKVGIGERLRVEAVGSMPGRLLNQFSMDEYDQHLRVATTIGWGDKSKNDVYVLDNNLGLVGWVKNLGLTERIYSVRFLADKGYVVTFRETDPFYVLDLSDPENPRLRGELKIPGYSSYLHPIGENMILGIGKEGLKVKISLFDVSSPEKPFELDKYLLDENWSEILTTHHAFLIDKEKKVFFLPGSRGGYIFSYDMNRLEMVRAVDIDNARRAIYIDNYLYIVSENRIVVLDENSWEEVNELRLI